MAEYIDREKIRFEQLPIAPILQGDDVVHYEQGALKVWIDEIHTADVIEIPKNATNGDMIKALFPNFKFNEIKTLFPNFEFDEEWKATKHFELQTNCTEITGIATSEWWNAPYIRE